MTRSARLAMAFVLCVLCVVILSAQTLTLTPSSATLRIGQSTTLVSSIAGASWSSSNTTVATVTNTGVVSGRGLGMATIEAKWRNQRATSAITVIASSSPLAITCPANQTRSSVTGAAIAVTYPTATTTGGVAPITVTGSPASGTTFQLGVTTVTATATSFDGQIKTCTFTVTVSSTAIDPTWVQISPGTTSQVIQTAVTGHTGATTFYLLAGVHRQQVVVPITGNTFIGAPGAIMDGENVAAHAFWAPATTPANVTIRNIEIKNYVNASGSQGAAIQADNGTNWVVETNNIHDNSEIGMRIGTGWIVRNNQIRRQSVIGMSGYEADGALIEGNTVYENNYSQLPEQPILAQAAGIKVLRGLNMVVRGNYVHHNFAKGIWVDGNYNGTIVETNTLTDNKSHGIYIEVSCAAIVRNNTSLRNAIGLPWPGSGILVVNSSNVEVHNNIVQDNANGIVGFQSNTPVFANCPTGLPNISRLENLNVHDNTVRMTVGKSGVYTTEADPVFTTWNNHFVHNSYSVNNGTALWFQWNLQNLTWTAWKGTGNDTTGTLTVTP